MGYLISTVEFRERQVSLHRWEVLGSNTPPCPGKQIELPQIESLGRKEFQSLNVNS